MKRFLNFFYESEENPLEGYIDSGVDDNTHPEPKRTVKAYKLFRTHPDHPGKLFPLFVDSTTPVPINKWIKATDPYSFSNSKGRYVPAKTGDTREIPSDEVRQNLIQKGFLKPGSTAKSIKGVAYRPGWHAGDLPMSIHIGGYSSPTSKKPDHRPDNQVWAEVEMPADVDWQSVANSRARITKKGTPDAKTAHITDQMPHGGFYRYKTNPNMTGNWMISGGMKVNRVLGDDEVKSINDAAGVADLPRLRQQNN